MISPLLLRLLRAQFKLDWFGIHGLPHWARVRANGLRLARASGANPRVVELFAFLHDSQRWDDGFDPRHGKRAGDFVRDLGAEFLGLKSAELECLIEACRLHSDGLQSSDATLATCWDADRLDLGRVGIYPNRELLGTELARDSEFLNAAYRRSLHPSPLQS